MFIKGNIVFIRSMLILIKKNKPQKRPSVKNVQTVGTISNVQVKWYATKIRGYTDENQVLSARYSSSSWRRKAFYHTTRRLDEEHVLQTAGVQLVQLKEGGWYALLKEGLRVRWEEAESAKEAEKRVGVGHRFHVGMGHSWNRKER